MMCKLGSECKSRHALCRHEKTMAVVILLAVLGFFAFRLAAAPAESPFTAARVTVPSNKSFEQVSDAIKTLVAGNGMMIMAQVDQGKMLSMTGLSLKATLYLVGNPVVGKQLFEQDHAVGLYVPLRLFVYSGSDGRTYVEYDRPSTLLAQFNNKKLEAITQTLDQKLAGLAGMAAQ